MKRIVNLLACTLLILSAQSCQTPNNHNTMKERINTANAPAAIGPYSQAIDSGAGLVFVSGQLPIDPATGAFPEGGVKEQTRQSLTNAMAILEAAGLSLPMWSRRRSSSPIWAISPL